MEANHSPPGRRTQIRDPNGPNRSLRYSPNYSLRPTRNLFSPTSQNHEPAFNQIIPNTGRFDVGFHNHRNALNDRLLRPCLRQNRQKIHRTRARHHVPPPHGNRIRDLDRRDARRRIRRDQTQTRRDRARAFG